MRRRDFVRSSVLTLGGACLYRSVPALGMGGVQADPSVRRVLAVFKCHFDAGFIDTQSAVVNRYFTEFFPQAMKIGEQSRRGGGQRYVWTTGSWLLYEYLEQASTEDRRRMEQAIEHGDIAWHAIPFTWQTEMMDPSMVSASIGLSKSLDRRFGRTTTGAKMTDVPGHTRGIISPLAEQGVKLLDVGVNGGCTSPVVPPLFVWKDSRGAELMTMYHGDYGGVVRVPGSDLAVAVFVAGDNSGPHSVDEIADMYAELGRRFPQAKIVAASLSEVANAIEPYRAKLPVVTQEIGDTWIYGIASDPLKLARFREVSRLRLGWIKQGKFKSGDATDTALLRRLLLVPEHTWGTDTKTWLDFDHYTPHELSLMLYSRNFMIAKSSWQEKRQDLNDGVTALPKPLHDEARARLTAMHTTEPKLVNATVMEPGKSIDATHFVLDIDGQTGAICGLKNKHTGIEWAAVDHPLALFTYQTLSQADYTRYLSSYGLTRAEWFGMDLGKPNIEHFGAESRDWKPVLTKLERSQSAEGDRVLAHLELRDAQATESGRVAFPKKLYLEIWLPAAEPVVHLEFSWLEKRATRMPEAMWLTFNPKVPDAQGWRMDKCGEQVSPLDVVEGGGRRMHAVTTGFGYHHREHVLDVECLDAPLIALGEKSPLNYSRTQPDLSGGVHSNLYNNAWGTNYVMWFDEDMRFRYLLRA